MSPQSMGNIPQEYIEEIEEEGEEEENAYENHETESEGEYRYYQRQPRHNGQAYE